MVMKKIKQIIIGFAILVSAIFPGGSAFADHNNYPNYIDWWLLERWTYAYEYQPYENSPMVEWLQYWIFQKPDRDGIYGPETHIAHRQKAMELNIPVAVYSFSIQDQDFGASVEQWRQTVSEAIAAYGGPQSDVPRFLKIMRCESNGDPTAYNASSGASGLMQHLENYWPWRAKMAGFEGVSPFDPIANIYTSAWLIYEHRAGGWQHWVCQ